MLKISGYLKRGLVVLLLLLVDIGVKYYTYHHIPKMSWLYPSFPYGGIGVFKNFLGISFSINHVQNLGAAWGFLSNYPLVLLYIRIALVLGMILFLWKFNKDKKIVFPLLLIVFGAIGNLLDIAFYGFVIDMFHINFWGYSYPLFNVADSMISIGIVWLFLHFLLSKRKKIEE